MQKKYWLGLIGVLLLAAVGGGVYYYLVTARAAQAATAAASNRLQTATARLGDLTILASASGSLIPANKVSTGFDENGKLIELNVQIGSQVKAGEVLARLQTNTTQENIEAAIANAELAVLKAQAALDTLYESAAELRTKAISNMTTYASAVRDAQYALDNYTVPAALKGMTPIEALDYAKEKLDSAREAFEPYRYYPAEDETRETLLAELAAAQSLYDSAVTQLGYVYALEVAQTNLENARRDYARYQDGPDPSELAMAQAELNNAQANLALAQDAQAVVDLTAPFDGVILNVTASVGESVNSAFITIANLQQPMLEIYLDETDLDKVTVGRLAEAYFDAYPEQTFLGHIVQVDPSLQSLSGVQTIRAWVLIDNSDVSGYTLPVGLNAAVDVVFARAENAVLIPIEALRDLGGGEYAVFVVDANGELVLRMVEIGLQDLTSVEIVSGLQAGEVISTGIVATK